MKQQRFWAGWRWIAVVLLLGIFISGCTEESTENNDTTTPSNPGKVEGLPDDPGEGNLAGKVVGTLFGDPFPNVTVSVGSRATKTDSDGIFYLNGVGSGTVTVLVTGSTVYTRSVSVNTANERSIQIDAIEVNSEFNLRFYREIARGNHPEENDMVRTHRWVNPFPPTFYINTNAEAALDGVISQDTIDKAAQVLRQVVPAFTGGLYSSIEVRTANFGRNVSFGQLPENSFVISFDDTLKNKGAYGMTYTEPDFISPSTSVINKSVIYLLDNEQFYKPSNPNGISFEEILAHESGHGFGFRHTSEPILGGLPSVMVKTGEYGGTYSYYDQLHMAIVYGRPAGNTDIDNDPGTSGAKTMKGVISEPQVFIDERADFPISDELQRQLDELEGFAMTQE